MKEWVRLCSLAEAPGRDEVQELSLGQKTVCLANIGGELRAMDNWCPHRQGPLGQGWVEGQTVVCPWHAWAFDTCTGEALPPEQAKVDVFAVRAEGDEVLIEV